MSRPNGTKAVQIALMGNPNVGKSTIFNRLTGGNQHTGNWPGKTVSVAQGRYQFKGSAYILVDLPGTYSLLSRSPEEAVAVEFLQTGQAACTVVVCDATCLGRTLALALQMMELTEKVIVCVNLMDEAACRSIEPDIRGLSTALGVPVVATAAGSGKGLEDLQEAIRQMTDGFLVPQPRRTLGLSWRTLADPDRSDQIATALIRRADSLARQYVTGDSLQPRAEPADRLLLHPVGGRVVMLLLLLGIFWLTIVGANIPSQWLQMAFSWLGAQLQVWLAGLPFFWRGLLVDGIYDTVARVVAVMLPPMAIFFPLFTILEDLGYLPRVAFLLDHCFDRAGACGKQALTMCMGFGCNAAGVVGCRIVDSPRERLMAIVTNALVPCNGRFPALILLITLFFAHGYAGSSLVAAALLTALVVLSVGVTLGASHLLGRTVLRGHASSFSMELPPYRRPQIGRIIVRSLRDRTAFVLLRAVEVAAPAGALLWCLANASIGGQSLLQLLSQWLNPIGLALGMSGTILLAFLLAAPANELMLPILCMILTAGNTLPQLSDAAMGQILVQSGWDWRTAVCVLIFFLFHWPCTTTVLTIRKETGSWRWAAVSILLPTAVGALLCAIVSALLRLV